MRLLFDHGVPSPLRRSLTGHEITFARTRGWDRLVNGRLIAAAEGAGFDLLVTCDKNWIHQQNLAVRMIGILVLPTNLWPHLRPYVTEITAAIERMGRGEYFELELPRPALNRRPPPGRKI